jgi:hypothetical protein
MAIVLGQDLPTLYRVGATTAPLIAAMTAAGAKFETPQLKYRKFRNSL